MTDETVVWTPEKVLRGILDDPYIMRLGSWRLRAARSLEEASRTKRR